jgi:predicted anti-sigma-YlaC factor YlaD
MRCDTIREALSARLDGEAPGLGDDAIDEHLGGCRACTAWADEVATLHRMVRVREAEPVPDLTPAILGQGAAAPRSTARRRSPLTEIISPARWALFVVALTQLVLAAPALLLGEDAGATVHVARELGAFDVALAVGLLVAAWQPARAWGLLPVVAALALVMGGTAVLDVARGTASSLGEVHHVLDLAGVALLWWVARDERLDTTSGGHHHLAAS